MRGSRHQLTGPAGKVGTRLSVGAWTVARATASLAETFASCHTGYEPVERTGGKKLKKIKIKIKKGGGAAIRTERVAEGRKLKGRVNRKERAKRNRVRGPRRGGEK